MNKVYIIIVNYNKFEDTIECLESVLKSNYLNFQIFVIDNSIDDCSTKQFVNWLTSDNYNAINTRFRNLVFPLEKKPITHCFISEVEFSKHDKIYDDKITIVRAGNNGFAAANNIVLRYLLNTANDSSLIWILNNDTVVEKDTLFNLVYFFNKNINEKHILSSKLKYYDRPDRIQAVAGKYNKWLGKHKHVGEGNEDFGQYDNYIPGKMDYIVGASIFLPLLFIQQAGLMCEDYFLYFEELDWIKMGSNYGFKIALVPNAIIYHKEGSSIIEFNNNQKDTSRAEYYSISNRVRFIKKWYPFCLVTVMPGVIWALIKRIFLGKFNLVKKISISIFRILFSHNPKITHDE